MGLFTRHTGSTSSGSLWRDADPIEPLGTTSKAKRANEAHDAALKKLKKGKRLSRREFNQLRRGEE